MSEEWDETYTEYRDTVSGKILQKCSIYNGSFLYKVFYYIEDADQYHREDGPAHISYREDGTVEERYYLNDVECDILQEMVIRGLQE